MPFGGLLTLGVIAGGAALTASDRPKRPHMTGPFFGEEELPGEVKAGRSMINALLTGGDPTQQAQFAASPFGRELAQQQFGPQERGRALGAFDVGQTQGLREILGQQQAAVQRAGLGGTTVPAQLESQARERQLFDRMRFEVQLDDMARQFAGQRLQSLLGIGGFAQGIAAPSLTPRTQQVIPRSPSAGEILGPQLLGRSEE